MIYKEQEVAVVTNGAMGSDFDASSMKIEGFTVFSFQSTWSGAAKKTAKIVPQVSNDNVNFCDLVSVADARTVDAASGCSMSGFQNLGYRWARMHFVSNSETSGTITCKILALRWE